MNLEMEKAKPIETLSCCCCGGYTRGRQWWNRDTGYGMCADCLVFVRSKQGYTEKTILSYYGVEGVHCGACS